MTIGVVVFPGTNCEADVVEAVRGLGGDAEIVWHGDRTLPANVDAVVLPGGFGTLDDRCESLTVVQPGKIAAFPVVLMGTEYWKPLCDFMRHTVAARGMVAPADLDLLTVTDSPDEAIAAIQRGVAALPASWIPPKRRRILFER